MFRNVLIRNMQDSSGKICSISRKACTENWVNRGSPDSCIRRGRLINSLFNFCAASKAGCLPMRKRDGLSPENLRTGGPIAGGSASNLWDRFLQVLLGYILSSPHQVALLSVESKALHPIFFLFPKAGLLWHICHSRIFCFPIIACPFGGKGGISEAAFRGKVILHSAPLSPLTLQLFLKISEEQGSEGGQNSVWWFRLLLGLSVPLCQRLAGTLSGREHLTGKGAVTS